jgi:predicted SnoaL-like aldol condensation-catalyzing enzyme
MARLLAKGLLLILLAFNLGCPAWADQKRAVELTFIKSTPNQRELLKQFIIANWFAMDQVAVANGLMTSYSLTDTGTDDGTWNVLVTVVYKNEAGYEGIKDAFEVIRRQHATVLVQGKALRDLGSIVDSKRTFETVAIATPALPKDDRLERNKANVLAFYDLMFNQSKPEQAMQKYGAEQYRQHNPEVPDGREAFVRFFEKMAKEYPGKSMSVKRVFAEGNFVIVHSEHVFPGWRGGSWAAIDIFRLDANGKIAEHWDVLQKVPDHSANSNGMF